MDMNEDLKQFGGEPVTIYRELEGRWTVLRKQYLTVALRKSIWRYSRRGGKGDPPQGWKLHLSATVLNACDMLAAVGPQLCRRGVLFKAPVTLHELDRINSGLHYGYSQVGKFITVYPQTDGEAVRLARLLHKLTRGMGAPSIPFDLSYRPESCVYYRYGSFTPLEMEMPDGSRVLALRDSQGHLVPDEREGAAVPEWLVDPFVSRLSQKASEPAETPLKTTFKAFRALTQRGKGGVYLAVDLSAAPSRLCILKEGRRNGETNWVGRDGYWRVAHEARVLAALEEAGIPVPLVYSSFRAEKNFYLAMEYVEGESLNHLLKRRRRRLAVRRALMIGLRLAELVARIHEAGWVWRDCKPGNVIASAGDELRPLDFEGACPVDWPDPLPWGTPSFVPPEWYGAPSLCSRLPEDLYALGAILYLLLGGRAPAIVELRPVEHLRRGIPPEVCRLIAELLNANPERRPRATSVVRRLRRALSVPHSSRKRETIAVQPSSQLERGLDTATAGTRKRRIKPVTAKAEMN